MGSLLDLESCGYVLGVAVLAVLYLLEKHSGSLVIEAPRDESELAHFLEDVGQLDLLKRLREWGAKTPGDLKHLIDEDFDELGIADNNAIRDAIDKLED